MCTLGMARTHSNWKCKPQPQKIQQEFQYSWRLRNFQTDMDLFPILPSEGFISQTPRYLSGSLSPSQVLSLMVREEVLGLRRTSSFSLICHIDTKSNPRFALLTRAFTPSLTNCRPLLNMEVHQWNPTGEHSTLPLLSHGSQFQTTSWVPSMDSIASWQACWWRDPSTTVAQYARTSNNLLWQVQVVIISALSHLKFSRYSYSIVWSLLWATTCNGNPASAHFPSKQKSIRAIAHRIISPNHELSRLLRQKGHTNHLQEMLHFDRPLYVPAYPFMDATLLPLGYTFLSQQQSQVWCDQTQRVDVGLLD